MTPIRVRGRKQKPSAKFQQANHVLSPKASSNTIMSNSARKPSALENLPTELLQQIFLQSLNLDLPRASLLLGSTLSSPHIKILLVLKAFSSDMGHGLEHSAELLRILRTRHDIVKLQSAILRLKWMNLDFLRQCIRVFVAKTLLRQFTRRRYDWKDIDSKLTESTVADFVEDAYRKHSVGVEEHGVLGLQTYEWNTGGPIHLNLALGLRDGLVRLQVYTADHDNNLSCDGFRWRLLYCLDGCQIPNKLLHGPWTDAKCDFLEVVTRGGASVDWINTTSGEVADSGLTEAVLEQNQRAVEVLVNIPLRDITSQDYIDYCAGYNHPYYDGDAPRKIRICGKDYVSREEPIKSSVGVPSRTEHLRIAVAQQVFSKGIIKCLLKSPSSRIDKEDSKVIQWALQKKTSGDRHGIWLYEMLSCIEKPTVGRALKYDEACFVIPDNEYFTVTDEDDGFETRRELSDAGADTPDVD